MTYAHEERVESIIKIEISGRELELHQVSESPCRRACPAGIDAKRYVGQIANNDYAGALATIRKHMPFPSACGRVCLHPCENECRRGEVDKPIAIMHLKRFVADYETLKGINQPIPEIVKSTGKKIAVIGSGPAGLTAAHDLALMGHGVTVFERANEPGGMLTQAIPEFELPSNAVKKDIERIERLGVRIKCGRSIHGEAGLQGLKNEGFDAILLATGATGRWRGLEGNEWIPGANLPGVTGAVEFMRKYRAGSESQIGRSFGVAAVLGLGVQALACVRTLVRLGCREVAWIVPVSKNKLQPDSRLIEQTEQEGVRILELTRPMSIENSNGRVGGIKIASLSVEDIDHTGREIYKPVPGAEKIFPCDTIIDAAQFAPDSSWDYLSSGPWGIIGIDPGTMMTVQEGIFAAGDAASGAKSVVEAVSQGHRAAAGIDRYLSCDKSAIGSLSTPIKIYGWEIDDPSRIPSEAYRPSVRPLDSRLSDFNEAEAVFTVWEAAHEARRCLLCGPCEECSSCLSICTRKRGVALDESGKKNPIRLPLGVARGIREEFSSAGAAGIRLSVAYVDPDRCRGCGVCEEICGYHAPRVAPDPRYGFISTIDIIACKGCGTCVAACPCGAINQDISPLHAIREAIRGGME
jgi:heterodisulfide reductase subunit A2